MNAHGLLQYVVSWKKKQKKKQKGDVCLDMTCRLLHRLNDKGRSWLQLADCCLFSFHSFFFFFFVYVSRGSGGTFTMTAMNYRIYNDSDELTA
ncbi:hypothetical protein M440DRAFT_285228 [Trichoderma longibrachiatum ATCC 18648]|uniref:Uncharacterized protein n=1 Tax=Trichoderma longibrachiatum ATCC 18648 TaxID=983965 RepID=A0A2T4C7P1_TRILO|nr:hypothetical protein M440DRAFT_285228 [Trichoderma longibrachiatum ATCC 18648]